MQLGADETMNHGPNVGRNTELVAETVVKDRRPDLVPEGGVQLLQEQEEAARKDSLHDIFNLEKPQHLARKQKVGMVWG